MSSFSFSAERQLIFYVNIEGQQRLVNFGERNAHGTSVFTTSLRKTAEAIRRSSLFKRGVIKETTPEVSVAKPQSTEPGKPAVEAAGTVAQSTEPDTKPKTPATKPQDADPGKPAEEVIEARNFTQAKSMLAKKLGIGYNELKTPDQLLKVAKENNISIVYKK